MRIPFLIIFSLAILFSCKNNVTEKPMEKISSAIDNSKVTLPYPDSLFQTFESTEDGVTYKMKQYYMVFLKKGPNRDQSEEEAKRLQAAHLGHLNKLAESRHICLVGPSDGTNDIQGFAVYSVPNKAEAMRLASEDPMVKAGRLTIEVQPWWAAIGGELF